MANYNVKLKRREEVAEGTMAFYLEKPAGFEYRAGQNADFTLINPTKTDAEGNTRTFSFITAPYEKELGLATRMRDTAFKNSLKEMALEEELVMAGPYGDFTLHKNEALPAVFIIGGIGITPALSILKEASQEQAKHKLILFHADKNVASTPFRLDLEKLAQINPNFKYIQVFSDTEVKGENIENGRMNSLILKKYVPDLKRAKYYLSGPEGMVKAMREMLVAEHLDEDNIKTEEFPGY